MQILSIIIPCHNEAARLPIEELAAFLKQEHNIHLVLVDDGSTDKTREILSVFQLQFPERVNTVFINSRSGKAEAVRTGIRESLKNKAASFHAYTDADLAVPIEELKRLHTIAFQKNYSFVFGSRIKKIGATIKRNEWRHFYSRIIATIVGSIIKLDVYDTQCSAKLLSSEFAASAFKEPFHTKWLFDVEVICRINVQFGELNKNGTEEPLLQWTEMKGSKLRWYNFFGIVREVFILKKHYKRN